MIVSWGDADTESIWDLRPTRRFRAFAKIALRKLEMLDSARAIDDLRVPPGNRLEKLRGGREGQWSIRINGQYRICFKWDENSAYDVEVTDYH
jgi:proteic killer suppression protein